MADLAVCEEVNSIQVTERGSLDNVRVKGKLDRGDVAKYAIRNVLLKWGIGWLNLRPEQRRAELALEAVELLSGFCQPAGKDWKVLRKQPWSAHDCLDVVETCKFWSMDGSYGEHMVDMATETPEWKHDPIPALKRQIRRRHYGG